MRRPDGRSNGHNGDNPLGRVNDSHSISQLGGGAIPSLVNVVSKSDTIIGHNRYQGFCLDELDDANWKEATLLLVWQG